MHFVSAHTHRARGLFRGARDFAVRAAASDGSSSNAGTQETARQSVRKLTARLNPAAVYGFVGWLGTLVGFLLYLLWAYLPVEILHKLGVTYYPSRYWAVAIPAYVCVFVLFIFTTYTGFCLMINPPLDAFSTFTDKHAQDKPKDWNMNSADDSRLPPIFDIPISEVNRLLYQRALPPNTPTPTLTTQDLQHQQPQPQPQQRLHRRQQQQAQQQAQQLQTS